MNPVSIAALVAGAIGLAGCDGFASPAGSGDQVDYRPEQSGTVDHALCLLGFSATPLQRLVTGHQLVEGQVNGKRATFLLDTGANATVVHRGHAETFGLVPQRGVFGTAAGLGGTLQASRASVESLRVEDQEIRQSHVMIADLSQVENVLGRLSRQPIHGILGQDVMREHRAVIDVARPMLYLRAAGSDPAPAPAELCTRAGDDRGTGRAESESAER